MRRSLAIEKRLPRRIGGDADASVAGLGNDVTHDVYTLQHSRRCNGRAP
jgi:hypothetical protein